MEVENRYTTEQFYRKAIFTEHHLTRYFQILTT